MKTSLRIYCILAMVICLCSCGRESISTDVLVVGGGTAGSIAAVQSARAGASTVLVEAGGALGGTTTTGGVSFPGLFHAWGRQVIGGIGWELVSAAVEMDGGEMPDFTVPFGTDHPRHQIHINPNIYSMLAEEACLDAGVEIRYYEFPTAVRRVRGGWAVDLCGKGGTDVCIRCRQLVD
ncbi:MAG: FAD-dependent oxidoreductase, partial [Bacteroidales bacterium]|nr:FAD-dependent oxidoreductase [Candidatus Equibacterium intestinale]